MLCKWITYLAAVGVLGCASAQSQAKPFVITIHALSAEDDAVRSGQNVVLDVRMLNNSQRTVVISEGNPAEDYVIEILDPSGIHPADTDYGLKLKKGGGKMVDVHRNISLLLKPGETGTDRIPISMMYDMRKVGKYSVQVSRRLPKELGDGIVKSNILTISVTG